MIKEAKGFGATIEEAKENAILNLGASDFDDVQFDVISMPKKKVLGIFGGNDAEVRAYIEIPDKKLEKKKSPKKSENKEKNKPTKTEVKPQPKKVTVTPEFSESVSENEISADSVPGKAIAYIRTVLAGMSLEGVEITVASRENASLINLDGEDLSILIGRRGETLDALQYLTGLVANNGGGHYKISLNISGYREKREETLIQLANRLAAQALNAGKCRTLEPMNPYERKIIHTAVQNIEGVHSGSFGEGAERRVVIAPEGVELKPRMMRNGRNDRKGRGNRRQAPKSNTVASTPTREPKRDSDIPLYGKIN
ncbi:MAG: KH domain-containing protein [Clostridia bacterium]|nr:KH domain-containing protein [Clostridia bacterium]